MVAAGASLHGEEILHLWELIETETWRTGEGTERADSSVLGRYRDAICERNKLDRPVRVVVDCGNGVASVIAVQALRQAGADVIPLFCESDGTFPNHHPDPTVPENLVDLQAEVRRTGAELGIAFDGDGDRIGAVDESGRILYGDQLLILFGRDAVQRFGEGTTVIFDVKCSDVLPEALRKAGAKPEMWKTGHSLIKARMQELGAPLAGEMSGHIFFGGDYFGFDDALFAAARLLGIVSQASYGLAALLSDVPATFATPEIRVDCPEDRKFSIVADAATYFSARYPVNTIDGVRMSFPEGWGLIRASNTQPVLVLRFEAKRPELLEAYRGEVQQWLAEQGVRA
jgi:phosphomannomutase/phosphoglucomutase